MARSRRHIFLGLLVALLVWPWPGKSQSGAKDGQWRSYAGDDAGTHYSPVDLINRENVKNLQIAWTWKMDNFGTGAEAQTSQVTPIMVDGVLYFTAGQRRTVVAAHPGTGETLWVWRPDEGARFDRAPRKVHRGVAYWGSGAEARILVVTPGFQLVALNAKTGAPIQGFGDNGIVDLFKQLDLDVPIDPLGRIGNSSPPMVVGDVVIVGPALSPGGRAGRSNVKADVMAFDVRTGKKVWTFHTIPRKGEPGYETWLNGSADYSGNAGVWAPMAADPALGYVYLPVESATHDAYGGHRPGSNLYSSTLVCLDAKTGKMIWHQQLVHHDIWDFDIGSHPILMDLTVDGRAIKAVVQLTKQSFAYVYDRTNGKPVWPIEERPVKASTVPTEWTAPTQPFPTKPPPFDLQGVSENDLIDFTPELRAEALKAIQNFTIGPLFTPPSAIVPDGNRGTIVVPGTFGGANWHTGAADPETGFVYVPTITNPSLFGLNPTANPTPESADFTMGGAVPTIQGLRLLKPPYGRITAINMHRGEIAWQIVNSDTPPAIKNNPALKGLTIPKTGNPSQSGLLVTKTMLFAGEGSGGQGIFHAYDKATGQEIWQGEMPGPQTSLPMTYVHQGRQFIVVAVRGSGNQAAQLVAFALPAPAAAGRGGRGGRGGGAAPAPEGP